jgi:hypothetical protein
MSTATEQELGEEPSTDAALEQAHLFEKRALPVLIPASCSIPQSTFARVDDGDRVTHSAFQMFSLYFAWCGRVFVCGRLRHGLSLVWQASDRAWYALAASKAQTPIFCSTLAPPTNPPPDTSDSCQPLHQGAPMKLPSARHFVNRLKELATIKRSVTDSHPGASAQECVTNFYGVPGIGKSALLAHIYQLYKHDLALLTIVIDLKALSESVEPFDLRHAKVQFIHELAQSIWPKNRPLEAPQSITDIGIASDDDAIEQAMSTLVVALSGFDKLIMLLIDSWEYAPEAMLAWVERLLLLPLVRKEQLVCLLGSQVALRWRQFEVRRRVQPYELAPLAADASKDQIGCAADLEHMIFEITAGLPLANEIVHAYLADQPTSVEWLLEHREQLARMITAETQRRVVNGMPEEIKPIFNILSLFREFDVHTLQTILPQFLSDFKSRSQSNLLQAVKQMVATRLVNWNDTLRAYQIDPTIRKIFARAQEWGDPQLYQAIRAAALKYYSELLGEVPSNRHVYLLELLYHRLYKAPAGSYNNDELQAEFKELLRDYYTSRNSDYADTYALGQLQQLLQQDQELEQALERHQIPPTLLANVLDTFIAAIPSPPHAMSL